mmetsp:Transcript_37095/g.111113  ORF Transcript_37095/g.111113 Transcript_37095/m.111113 type:complete len:208 (+) Transcript_37095:4674-5297(+)
MRAHLRKTRTTKTYLSSTFSQETFPSRKLRQGMEQLEKPKHPTTKTMLSIQMKRAGPTLPISMTRSPRVPSLSQRPWRQTLRAPQMHQGMPRTLTQQQNLPPKWIRKAPMTICSGILHTLWTPSPTTMSWTMMLHHRTWRDRTTEEYEGFLSRVLFTWQSRACGINSLREESKNRMGFCRLTGPVETNGVLLCVKYHIAESTIKLVL